MAMSTTVNTCMQEPSGLRTCWQKFTILVMYSMKKLLNSDQLRTVQFKCNISTKGVTPVQITVHILILDYDGLKDNRNFLGK